MTLPTLEQVAPELVGFVLSGLVVLYGWPRARSFREWVDRTLIRREPAASPFPWGWRVVALALGGAFAVAAFVQSAPIPCSAGEDDTLALLQSGRGLLAGGDPFATFQCGHSVLIPYGLAGAILDGLGSLGGRVGIWLIWDLMALLLIPLTWYLAPTHRGYATIFVATSMLYAPLVVGSIQGGHSAIVPVTALLGLWLARRENPVAGAVAGFLSTVKFPSLFPFWGGLAGVGRGRWFTLATSATVFAGLSALVVLVWGGYAYTLLFSFQLIRADFSINEFGVLIPLGAMPPASVLTILQGVSLLSALLYVHLRRWPAIPAVALLTVVVALVAQRFTENFLIWLLPVALLGPTYSRWLFAIGAVGVLNGAVALPACTNSGACGPSEGLAGALGVMLLVLLVLILRESPRSLAGTAGSSSLPIPPVSASPSAPLETSSTAFHSAPRIEGVGTPTGPRGSAQ
ncbi:MAG: hypothetical protein L3K14_01725 [Thermoplasmata archaeon]|nr:hypothetical protein [Thermoplasmata archaeon]